MIVTEFYRTRDDGTNLVRTYSDNGCLIERDGVLYEEAIDPENSGRVYIESTELINTNLKAQAYDILMGVSE